MKLLFYVMTTDTGLAPNPFNGYCTLAVCTPNHRNAKLEKGDWILGHSAIDKGNKLVYLMRLSESPMNFNDYFNDPRFQTKKPNQSSKNWRNHVGDNMYHQTARGWVKIPSGHHDEEKSQKKDYNHPVVFISKLFYFFGEKAISMKGFEDFIWKTHGFKYMKDESRTNKLVKYISDRYKPGIIGLPGDRYIKCNQGSIC